jgi:glycosyltransferase involved in cell wall biosynthesis
MKTGIVVRRNVRSIARGIRKLIRSGELREELAQNALAHIALYEWNHLGQRIIRWYEEKEADRKETAKHG